MKLIPEIKIHITGDSRFDRVLERKKNIKDELLPSIYKKSKTIILGSIESSDYPILFSGLKKYYPDGQESLINKNHNTRLRDRSNGHHVYTIVVFH